MKQKILLSIVCFIFWSIGAFAQYSTKTGIPERWDEDGGPILVDDYVCNFFKDKETGELCVTTMSYYGKEKNHVKIPRFIKYNGKKYTVRIANFISEGVETVTIPQTAIVLGTCSGAKHVLFEKDSELRIIEDGAFQFNENLETINIPSTVDSIGTNAFTGCKNLRTIRLPRYISAIKSSAFYNCENLQSILWTEEQYKGLIPKDIVDKSLKKIEDYTFCGCGNLQNIEFPGTYQSIEIGERAFYGCKSLKSVMFNDRLIGTIGNYAFSGCTSLSTLKEIKTGIDNKIDLGLVKIIGDFAFSNCSSIKNINLLYTDTIKNSAFTGCTSLQESFFNSIKYIGQDAFRGCSSLKKVFFGDSLQYLADAFGECKALESVYFKNLWNVDFGSSLEGMFPTITNDFEIKNVLLSYSYRAKSFIKEKIEIWKKKKEYETTTQWRERVNEGNQRAKVTQLLDSARTKYIKEMAPKEIKCSIMSYDADDGVYKMRCDNLNTYKGYIYGGSEKQDVVAGEWVYTYAKVPVSEAPAFKENFDKVKIEPTYCIAKNYLGIASCKFTLNGKTYVSPVLYDDETANVQIDLPPLEIDLGGGKKNDMASSSNQEKIDDTLDKNIPSTNVSNNRTFVVIIGNEKYSQVANVPYAERDAKVFAEYCRKTLGVPDKNVRTYGNATYAGFVQAINDIKKIAEAYNGDLSVVFYYAGHGVPNEQSKDAYLLPVDADGKQMDVCYSVGKLYKELNGMNAKNVVVFMDACFSGSQRGDGMLASARGVALKAKAETPQGKMVVFSAATGDETAYPYKEKGHGLFTYFLLKKLQESKGDCTLGELGEYIQQNVRQQSVVINRKSQSPTVMPSQTMIESWKNMKLR